MRKLVGTTAGLIGLLTCVCAFSVSLAADEKNAPAEQNTKSQNPFDISLSSGDGPINIRSGKLEFFYNEKRIVYRGDVLAKRDTGTIKSDILTVTYDEPATNTKPGTPQATPTATNASSASARRQRIKEAVAEGNVEITSPNGNATCKKAIFNELKRTVTLSGNAVLRDGENVVKGQVVTIFLDENRVTVEGAPGAPPEMEITPKGDDKNKKEAKTR